MKHSLLNLSALAAAIVGTGVAFAAFTNVSNDIDIPSRATATQDVSATWAMAVPHDQVAAEVTPATAFTNPAFTIGDGITFRDVWTVGGIPMSRYTIQACENGGRQDNQYFEFSVTPTAAVTLTSISFDMINDGWGGGTYDYVVTTGSQTKELLNQKPRSP